MSHIPYTICRSGTYYYNRRVPKHAVKAYGLFIRQALSKCPEEAEAYAKRLGDVLEGSWRRTTERVQPVDIPSVLASFKPRSFVLSEMVLSDKRAQASVIGVTILFYETTKERHSARAASRLSLKVMRFESDLCELK